MKFSPKTTKVLYAFNKQMLGCFLIAAMFLTSCQQDLINPQEAENVSKIEAFDDFIQAATDASFEKNRAKDASQVASEEAFEKMRSHLLQMYEGINVHHSFELEDGRVCDCIPVEGQPSLTKAEGGSRYLDTPPPFTPETEAIRGALTETTKEKIKKEQIPVEKDTDRFGNSRKCTEGYIPMIRITLKEMTRFKTLDNFFHKCDKGDCFQGKKGQRADHRYAYMGDSSQDNNGGNSWLNLWRPSPSTNNFSLSQQWYSADGPSGIQTVEGGWQVYPNLYGNTRPNLFIYYTTAGYSSGSGCYNLTCAGFVQTSNDWVIGSSFNTTSQTNGSQYSFRMHWYKYAGNWWLWLEGYGRPSGWIGYYPGSLYGSGQMADHATSVLYGGEVTATNSGSLSGAMGSGAHANQAWGRAAYQRQVYRNNVGGGTSWMGSAEFQPDLPCYTIDTRYSTGSTYGRYFYFGGPSCDP